MSTKSRSHDVTDRESGMAREGSRVKSQQREGLQHVEKCHTPRSSVGVHFDRKGPRDAGRYSWKSSLKNVLATVVWYTHVLLSWNTCAHMFTWGRDGYNTASFNSVRILGSIVVGWKRCSYVSCTLRGKRIEDEISATFLSWETSLKKSAHRPTSSNRNWKSACRIV